MSQKADARRHAPATLRNRSALLQALRPLLPADGLVLEVACGTGEHAAFLAAQFPRLRWQPTDPDAGARASTDAWASTLGVSNVLPAWPLDVAAAPWPACEAASVVCINMVHIAPVSACYGLMRGCGQVLHADGTALIYGPFFEADVPPAASNLQFDAMLRAQDHAWGVRSLALMEAAAQDFGLRLRQRVVMPANNRLLVFGR